MSMATERELTSTAAGAGVVEGREKQLFFSCMNVQSDWKEAATKDDKFWVSCKRPVQEHPAPHMSDVLTAEMEKERQRRTVYGHLQKIRETGNIESVDDKFTVKAATPSSVAVQCNLVDGGCKTMFIRPQKTIHLHNRKLSGMDVSGSGGLGVCASEDGKAWVWDPDNGQTMRELKGHVMDVETCCFFPSGVVALTGGADMKLKIWSAQDGSCPRTLIGHAGGITDTAMIDRGRNIVSVSRDGTARLWDCGSAHCLAKMASLNHPIHSCSLTSSEIVAQRNTTLAEEPECGTDDKLLALACGDRYLRGVDIRSRKSAFQFFCGAGVPSSCVFVSEFDVVCGSDDGQLTVLDVRHTSAEKVVQFFHTSSAVTCLSPLTAQTCTAGYADGSVIIWRLDDLFAPIAKLTGPDIDHVTSICIRGNTIYTGCRDGCVRVYSTDSIDLSP